MAFYTLDWNTFENTYLRPELSAFDGSLYNFDTLQSLTYLTISDLRAKSIDDLEPSPSSTTIPATAQVNFIFPGNVSTGNVFYINRGNTTLSFSATTNTVEHVVAGITNVINNSTSSDFTDLTAFDAGAFVRLVGEPGIAFEQYSTATKGTGSSNPTLSTEINAQAKAAETVPNKITEVGADWTEAFRLIAVGVKYFLVTDPISKLKTTAGLDITKDPSLVDEIKQSYNVLTDAYIQIHKLQPTDRVDAQQFWIRYFNRQYELKNVSSGGLTLTERLQLIEAENLAKLQQISAEGQTDLATAEQKRIANLELLNLKRQHELDDREALLGKKASNGAWTNAGQMTITHLVDYGVELEDTVVMDLKKLDNTFFGLPTIINAETIMGAALDVGKYRLLSLKLISNAPVTFKLLELIEGAFVEVGTPTTDNSIVKSYSLVNTSSIRLEITGTQSNTSFFIEAELSA